MFIASRVSLGNEDFSLDSEMVISVLERLTITPSPHDLSVAEQNVIESIKMTNSTDGISISKSQPDPLFFAIENDYCELLVFLINTRKLLPTKSHLDFCVRVGSLNCAKILMDHWDAESDETILSLQRHAILARKQVIAEYLVKRTEIVDVRTLAGIHLPSLLDIAIRNRSLSTRSLSMLVNLSAASGDAKSIEVLLLHIDKNQRKEALKASLFFGVGSGDADTVRVLVENGAANNLESWMRPTHLACLNGDAKIIEILNRAGFDWKLKDSLGRSCLHFAVLGRNQEIVTQMLGFGCDPNQTAMSEFPSMATPMNIAGYAPLHVAAATNQPELIKVLLDGGANIDLRTQDGTQKTALEIARSHNANESIRLLVERQQPGNNRP